ncbi:hypothetical protein S83_070288, partial [Arachis hypogaea]
SRNPWRSMAVSNVLLQFLTKLVNLALEHLFLKLLPTVLLFSFIKIYAPTISDLQRFIPAEFGADPTKVQIYDQEDGRVFVKENDVAAFTISTVDEPRTLNKVLYLRPSENIYSLNELVEMGENGESRLGIRRAVRPRNGLPESIVGNQSCYPNFLSSVANAISAKSMFHVFYSP